MNAARGAVWEIKGSQWHLAGLVDSNLRPPDNGAASLTQLPVVSCDCIKHGQCWSNGFHFIEIKPKFPTFQSKKSGKNPFVGPAPFPKTTVLDMTGRKQAHFHVIVYYLFQVKYFQLEIIYY